MAVRGLLQAKAKLCNNVSSCVFGSLNSEKERLNEMLLQLPFRPKKREEKGIFFALPQFIRRRHRCVPKKPSCAPGGKAQREQQRRRRPLASLPFPFQVEEGWGVYSWLGSLSCGFVFPKLHLSVFFSPGILPRRPPFEITPPRDCAAWLRSGGGHHPTGRNSLWGDLFYFKPRATILADALLLLLMDSPVFHAWLVFCSAILVLFFRGRGPYIHS